MCIVRLTRTLALGELWLVRVAALNTRTLSGGLMWPVTAYYYRARRIIKHIRLVLVVIVSISGLWLR
jgi:hypothetical protein